MAIDSETSVPESYPYYWSSSSSLSIDEFLSKYKPSMVEDDGTKPWIWVEKTGERLGQGEMEKAIQEGAKCVEEATTKVTEIQNDDKIPTRSNKKTGAKSKKELREQVQAETSSKLKEISQETGYTVGKWLLFTSPDSVEGIWPKIARSLVSGALSSTPAFLAKVSTSKRGEEHPQHLICLYLPDMYDKAAVTEVLKVLLGKCGVTPSSTKTDLYTHIGIDSKHPSGIRSTVWQTKELLSDDEIKKLREEYTAEQAASKPKASKPTTTRDDPFVDEDEDEAPAKPAPKPVPKRKDDFEDDDDDVEGEAKPPSKKPPSKKPPSTTSKKPASKASKRKVAAVAEDEHEEEPKPAKKPRSAPAKPEPEEDQSETETESEPDEALKKSAQKPVVPPAKASAEKAGTGRLGKLKVANKSKYD